MQHQKLTLLLLLLVLVLPSNMLPQGCAHAAG
jgi:hypothetical protein